MLAFELTHHLNPYIDRGRHPGMGRDPCESCGRPVTIAGGIAGIWRFSPSPSGGMTLAFEDGTETFLCFDCLDRLPEEPTPADVDELVSRSAEDR